MKEYWQTISTKVVHKNDWYKIVKKKFKMPSNKLGDYFVLETNGSSFVVAVNGDKILFCKQYRYLIDVWAIELPGGGVKPGSNYIKTAKDELKEELGYTGKLKFIGKFAPMNGISSKICKVYLATDLKYLGHNREATECMKTIEIKIEDAYRMLDQGRFIDGMTVCALSLARELLLNKK